jgi:hypothetical protein
MEYPYNMKTRGKFSSFGFQHFFPGRCPSPWGIPAVLLAFMCGCATEKPGGVSQVETPMLSRPVSLEPGAIAVVCRPEPAVFSFDQAVGRVGYASDGAGALARACLDPPTPPVPELDLLISPVGLVLSPFAAAYGAVTANRAKMNQNQLSDCESDLARTMTRMADQMQFRDQLLQTAGEVSGRRLMPLNFLEASPPGHAQVSAVLETRVEELRLERSGSKDTSFTLRVKTRVRLHRVSDGQLLCDLPFEYRSGSALFLDWSYPETFRGVAETAYRELSKEVAKRLLLATPEGPVLVGAGNKNSLRRAPSAPNMFVTYKAPSPGRLLCVSYAEDDSGTPGLWSNPTLSYISIQRPLTKDEAVAEAISDVEWSLDGLQNSRNLGVQLSAFAAAIPMSLCKQTVGLLRGVTSKKFRSADRQLTTALIRTKPQKDLAEQVALQLAPWQSEPVMLARNTLSTAAGSGSARTSLVGAASMPSQDADTVLEVQVRSAALTGEGGVNPSLALCLEARATLFRVSDHVELYSCPVHYRGEKRKFTKWAANDARLFRQELKRCYHDVSTTMVDQLVARGVISPSLTPPTTLAKQ